VETAIGVFASRDGAEGAVRDLLGRGVPEQAIVFLTRAEAQSGTARQEGSRVAATLMSVPGIGQVFALGLGAAALLGLGATVDTAAAPLSDNPISDNPALQPTPDENCSDDVVFFRDLLQQGRSLVVVRTDSAEVARTASRRLDCLGLGLRPLSPAKMQAAARQIGDIAVIDVSGKITYGDGNAALREIVHDQLGKNRRKILLNLREVHYIDSSGMGELVRLYTTIRDQGGMVRLVDPSARVRDLLQMTRLNAVFQIENNEAAAVASLGGEIARPSLNQD
jgi:anti-sigma B factor antagonist